MGRETAPPGWSQLHGMVPGDMQAAGHQPPAQHGAGPLVMSILQQLRGADYCHLDFTGKKAEAER